MKVTEDSETRDPVARELFTPKFRPRVVEDKRRREGRQAKHKNQDQTTE